MNQLKTYLQNIDTAGLAIKFLSWLFILLLPIRSAMVAALCLILADFVSGIWASLKEKKKITSHGMRRTIIKVLAYEAAILVSFLIETYLLDGMPVVKIVTGLIGITEGKSFFENIHRITGVDFWAEIVSKLNLSDIKNDNNQSK